MFQAEAGKISRLTVVIVSGSDIDLLRGELADANGSNAAMVNDVLVTTSSSTPKHSWLNILHSTTVLIY